MGSTRERELHAEDTACAKALRWREASTERLRERVAQMWLEGHVGARLDSPSRALIMI